MGVRKRARWMWLWSGEYEPENVWLRRANRLLTVAIGVAAFWNLEHHHYSAAALGALICAARIWPD